MKEFDIKRIERGDAFMVGVDMSYATRSVRQPDLYILERGVRQPQVCSREYLEEVFCEFVDTSVSAGAIIAVNHHDSENTCSYLMYVEVSSGEYAFVDLGTGLFIYGKGRLTCNEPSRTDINAVLNTCHWYKVSDRYIREEK